MSIITIDFETFYDTEFSLSKMTTEAYINDDLFEVIGVAVKVDDGPIEWFSGTYGLTRQWLAQFDWANSLMLAHNAVFDGAILAWRFKIIPKGYLDTLSMARAIHGPEVSVSLAKLAERYCIGIKGTEVLQAKGKRRVDFTRTELAAYGGYCETDVQLTYDLFQCLIPGFPRKELKIIDATLRMYTTPVLQLDVAELESHLEEVRAEKERLLERCAQDPKDLASNPKFAELLRTYGVEPPTKTSLRTGKQAWAFAKTDKDFIALTEHPDVRVQAIMAARLGTKSTIEESRTDRLIQIAKRTGLLAVPLRAYGAKTGRWSVMASEAINMQNVPRKSRIKRAIQAPKRHVIIGADLSNIELRVGLWLAGHDDKLAVLASGEDLYKDFAADVFSVDYDDVTPEQRFIGKTSQLSLIFGVGHRRLRSAIQTGSGLDIGEDESQRIVKLYRHDYHRIRALWFEGADVLEAIFSDQHTTMARDGFFEVEGRAGIRLPSGLLLQYPDLQSEEGPYGLDWSYRGRNHRERLYGAKVFQGLTQATARCVIAEQMVQIQKRYPIALVIHDAVYLVVPEQEADQVQEFVIREMRTAPSWITGIPLDVEAKVGYTLADV